MVEGKILTESMEDYLEMFYRLFTKQGYVRPVDLSDAIGIPAFLSDQNDPKLNEAGFITYENTATSPLPLGFGIRQILGLAG